MFNCIVKFTIIEINGIIIMISMALKPHQQISTGSNSKASKLYYLMATRNKYINGIKCIKMASSPLPLAVVKRSKVPTT